MRARIGFNSCIHQAIACTTVSTFLLCMQQPNTLFLHTQRKQLICASAARFPEHKDTPLPPCMP